MLKEFHTCSYFPNCEILKVGKKETIFENSQCLSQHQAHLSRSTSCQIQLENSLRKLFRNQKKRCIRSIQIRKEKAYRYTDSSTDTGVSIFLLSRKVLKIRIRNSFIWRQCEARDGFWAGKKLEWACALMKTSSSNAEWLDVKLERIISGKFGSRALE